MRCEDTVQCHTKLCDYIFGKILKINIVLFIVYVVLPFINGILVDFERHYIFEASVVYITN